MKTTITSLAAVLLFANGQVHAAAGPCFNFAVGPSGICNVDQSESGFLQAFIVQDHDNTNCDSAGTFRMAANYYDLRGNQIRASAISSQSVASSFTGTVPFNFKIPLASIGTASPVTLTITASGASGSSVKKTITWNMLHSSTIVYTTSSTSVTKTLTSATTSVSTNTQTATATSVNSNLPIVTQSGVATKFVNGPRNTVISTITPAVYTSVLRRTSTLTSTLTCQAPIAPIRKRSPVHVARAFVSSWSVPYCAAIATQTITTGVATTQVTVTSTATFTSLKNFYSTSTVVVAPTTKISVTSTTTSTVAPAADFTSFSLLTQSIVKTTSTTTVTKYEKPRSSDLSVCKANISSASPTARITMTAKA